MTSRRDAVRQLAALMVAPGLVGLTPKGRIIGGGFADDFSTAGHALRDGQLPLATGRPTRRVRVAIVGGGVAGLSAGWHLDALGVHDWVLCELGASTGGNARSARYPGIGQAAPWGAHYLPVPSASATHVRTLLREVGVLGTDGQFHERALCHTPQERLFQHGRWHEGLEPMDALPRAARAQFAQFEALTAEFRASGAFAVPSTPAHAHRAALAPALRRRVEALDTLSAHDWLTQQGLTASAVRWWVEYGTRDDYGASLRQASAWAAVHYFAGREADEAGPLTWPEGNDFLVRHLRQRVDARRAADGGPRALVHAPVWQLERRGTRWRVDTPAARLDADVVIWSAPLFVLPRALPSLTLPVTLEYAPWVVANIVLDRWPAERGAPLAWDNVIYDSPSLGYVNAAHQRLGPPALPTVWTWYHAVTDRPAREARAWLAERPWAAWRDQIVADLSRAHPGIEQAVVRVDVMRWGHAMARPTPGLLARTAALAAWRPAPGLLVAHADLSGVSLFEEAQWHGVQAAVAAAARLGGERSASADS